MAQEMMPLGGDGNNIGADHVGVAIRVKIVRRCKQAGMYWRHANAVRMAAIHAP